MIRSLKDIVYLEVHGTELAMNVPLKHTLQLAKKILTLRMKPVGIAHVPPSTVNVQVGFQGSATRLCAECLPFQSLETLRIAKIVNLKSVFRITA